MKRKTLRRALSVLLAAVLVLGTVSACKSKSKSKSESSADAEDVADAGYVSFQEGFTDVKVVDGASALKAVATVADSLGLKDPEAELKLAETSSFDGETYYRLQQYYNDTPVFGRDVVLVANEDGKALALSSNIAKTDKVSGEKKDPDGIDYEKLLSKVEGLLKNDKLSFLDFQCVTQPETVYYSEDGKGVRACFKDIISFKDTEKRQYAFEVLYDCDTYELVTADAVQSYAGKTVNASGKDKDGAKREFVAYRENSKKYLMVDKENDIAVYNANNNTVELYEVITDDNDHYYYYNNGQLYDEKDKPVHFNSDNTALEDENGKVVGRDLKYELLNSASPNADDLVISESTSAEWNDANAVSAVSRVQNAYNFYKDILGRNSYNDKGGAIRIFYNDALNGDSGNAYSYDQPDMTALSFGSANNIAFDVVGHEFTHSVIGSIVDLPYRNQTGAINEAYADIFGEIIEDFMDGEMNNNCNWITDTFRNQIDPESEGNPVTYRGQYWSPNISVPDILRNTPLEIINLFTDNGGVHTNSTVLSHAAYLMNHGIDGDASKMIDTQTLAKIWYKSMFSLHSNETFRKCARHVYEAATRTNGLTEAQLSCVKEAFAQAGLEVE